MHNSKFGYFVYRIYTIEFEIKYTTYTDRSASYLNLHLEIDGEGLLRTKLPRMKFIYIFFFVCLNVWSSWKLS